MTEKTTHTPGLWHVERNEVWAGDVQVADNLRPGDARLIAAAPALLAVLARLEAAVTAHGLSAEQDDATWAARFHALTAATIAARALIAQAEGR